MTDILYLILTITLIVINHIVVESKFTFKFNDKAFNTNGVIIIDAIIVAIYFLVKYI